ncbi:hypothetical protein B0A54_16133 [Friedmanniomyces endolithicus]|uniref:Transcription factor domain-containing protein n=1 Tax=Friedmanniomyces endolithicus TaxID=329885 RepID=A0A4U0U0W7_9PEZI|nr:hypothetical protein B0A54_16133 [Friedmanniomyces endolithicus]
MRHPVVIAWSGVERRIARLEGEIAGLWRHVKAQKPNVPPSTTDSVVDEVTDDGQGGNDEIDSESEMSDASPATAPTHLQLLFNNSLLDSQDVPEQVSQHPRQQKSSEARLSRARSALQCLIIPEENAAALVARAAEWVTWANSIAPLVFVARTKDELMLDWDQARGPEAQPTMIAAVLLITAMTIHLAPQSSLHGQLSDASAYSKAVSDVIETYIVNDDFFAGSLEGIEVCLLFQRLHFAHARFHKVWLSLRRTIALAEIIGLPRASMTSSGDRSDKSGWTCNGQTREEAGALLWQTACTMERLAGCMFGLPITAKMNPFPTERPVFVGTHLVPQAYFCRLADIAGKIPALDDLHAKGRPSHQLCSMVLNIDSEFRDLASLAPRSWWDVHPNPERITVDLVFQYFHQYFTARAHLQLALNNDTTNIYAYSHMIVDSMDLASRGIAGHFAQEAARAIRSLSALLSSSSTAESQYISLRVPLLGRIHVRRLDAEPKPAESLAGSSAAPPPTRGARDAASMPLLRGGRTANVAPFDAVANDPNSWSMEISEVVPFLTDDAYTPDQWLMLGDFNTGDSSIDLA